MATIAKPVVAFMGALQVFEYFRICKRYVVTFEEACGDLAHASNDPKEASSPKPAPQSMPCLFKAKTSLPNLV